uniref:Uncharacterized protein n=1 Tax=Trichobilharzia regenti TaxID=157069 RepID=A0AA85J0F5_TRIRE|nr:unnamed protein product [Trichobilharzia regenti]
MRYCYHQSNMSNALNVLFIVFIITVAQIHNVESGLGSLGPKKTLFMAFRNQSLGERFRDLARHCFTSVGTWMVLLG